MFSSKSRRASTVSDGGDKAGDGAVLAEICAHPIAVAIATTRRYERLLNFIHL
jgi:hypothetical protein